MKKQVFIKAWELVRMYGINLSNALTIAWATIKVEIMQVEIEYLESMAFTGCAVMKIEKVQFPLMKRIKDFTPSRINWKKTYDNSGARFDYGVGLYNGD